MAKESSFDVVSNVDMQEVDNAVNQAKKEILTRYDFRGSKSSIEVVDNTIVLIGDDDFKLKAVQEILRGKMVKRGIALKNLAEGKVEPAAGATVRQVWTIRQGLSAEHAKEVTKCIKNAKLKVTAQIMGDQVRVAGKDKDTLQEVIQLLKQQDFPVELQFVNYR
ncbi:MAG: YajQ family cyclic di-GMP-binding protein [Veillonellaceae bacterium]|nr:YajQ family cyclic di-GMP-binding protein [Veillonellaceae bacterium]